MIFKSENHILVPSSLSPVALCHSIAPPSLDLALVGLLMSRHPASLEGGLSTVPSGYGSKRCHPWVPQVVLVYCSFYQTGLF